MAASAWAMPAAGLPVASTTTSMSSAAQASAPRSMKRVPAMRASSHPTAAQAARARAGSRSAMTGTSSPGMVGTWARNMEPNLPAPIRATRTERPLARWAARRWVRFIGVSAPVSVLGRVERMLRSAPRHDGQGMRRACARASFLSWPGRVPAIHAVAPARSWRAGVDARDEPGHDGGARSSCAKTPKAAPRATARRRRCVRARGTAARGRA